MKVYAPVPSFLPSMPWSPVWGMSMGLPVGLQSSYNAPNSTYISNWNSSATSVTNYCNYWVKASHITIHTTQFGLTFLWWFSIWKHFYL